MNKSFFCPEKGSVYTFLLTHYKLLQLLSNAVICQNGVCHFLSDCYEFLHSVCMCVCVFPSVVLNFPPCLFCQALSWVRLKWQF